MPERFPAQTPPAGYVGSPATYAPPAPGITNRGVSNKGAFARSYWAIGRYKFSEDGGAIGTIALEDEFLPSGAVIIRAFTDILVGLASAGAAAVTVGIESADDLIGPGLFADWGVSIRSGLAVGPFKTTAPRKITATIGGAPLTAGEFVVYVEYLT